MRAPWNHNIHYHRVVLSAVPPNCRRALDVGCGQGLLARQLLSRCEEVVGIDLHPFTIPGITFVEGDAMTHPFASGSFDFISVVATLHHLPLEAALSRFRDLLKPGGVLAIVGLYRRDSLTDFLWDALAVPISLTMRVLRGEAEVGAPTQEPKEKLAEIRAACPEVGSFRRRLYFRYSFVWRKP